MSAFSKILKYLFAFLLFIGVLLNIFFHSHWVTTALKTKLGELFSNQIVLGQVSIDFLGRLNVHDLEIQVDGLPLAIGKNLMVSFNLWELLKKNVVITEIIIESLHLRFVRDIERNPVWDKISINSTSPPQTTNLINGFWGSGLLTVHDFNLLVETSSYKYYKSYELSVPQAKFLMDPKKIKVQGYGIGDGIDPLNFLLLNDSHSFSFELSSPKTTWTKQLANIFPRATRKSLQKYQPQGNLSFYWKQEIIRSEELVLNTFEIKPVSLFITPPQLNLKFEVLSGKLYHDQKTNALKTTEMELAYFDNNLNSLIHGRATWDENLTFVTCHVNPKKQLIKKLPENIRFFLEQLDPQGKFNVTLWNRPHALSLKSDFKNLDLIGPSPEFTQVTGTVSVDQILDKPMIGKINLSSLKCLGLEFTEGAIPLKYDESIQFGFSEKFKFKGPWSEAQGNIIASSKNLTGKITLLNTQLNPWIKNLFPDEAELHQINGLFNASVELDVPKNQGQESTGNMGFRISDCDYVISNQWLQLARLFKKPQDLIRLPLLIFTDPKNQKMKQQKVLGARGNVNFYNHHFEVDAEVKGDPFNFDAKAIHSFEKKGKATFTPILISRYDPTKLLLDLIPIEISWENGKIISK